MRPNSHGSLSRVNHLEHAGRDQPGGHIRVVVVVGGEAQLPRRRLPCTVGRVPPGREVLHRDKALIRQCRLLVRLSVHALVGVRGEGDGGLGVLCCVGLHSHPRAREGEMPETSGASQVHLRLSMEVLLRQLRNLERSRPPAAPHCDSICVQ